MGSSERVDINMNWMMSFFMRSTSWIHCRPPASQLFESEPFMLQRNMNPPKLCNYIKLHRNVNTTWLTGCSWGESVFIPAIPFTPSNYTFDYKRVQFSISMLRHNHKQSSWGSGSILERKLRLPWSDGCDMLQSESAK